MEINSDEYYLNHYESILNSGLLGKLKSFTHSFQEKQIPKDFYAKQVIELGAGNGTHKRFVNHGYANYIQTDLREQKELNIRSADAEDLAQFKDSEFERLIATCLLAHLPHPDKALKEWRRVITDGGIISIYVPCEPGLFLRLFRFFTTNLKGRRQGINHYSFHYVEHRNYFISLKYNIAQTFNADHVSTAKFPFKYFTWNFNFFVIYTIRVKKHVSP